MQFKKNIRLMGNQFEFTLIDENENVLFEETLSGSPTLNKTLNS